MSDDGSDGGAGAARQVPQQQQEETKQDGEMLVQYGKSVSPDAAYARSQRRGRLYRTPNPENID